MIVDGKIMEKFRVLSPKIPISVGRNLHYLNFPSSI